MAPLYEVVMMTKSGKGATVQLTSLLQNCAKSLWSRGAVLADIRPWGARDLAYRIRKQSENHYSAQYVSMDVYCSPPTLHQLEGQLRTSPHVLRYLTFKKSSLPAFDKEARNPFLPKRPEGAIDLEADATERAKWEYVRTAIW
ncbi:30s ribosomal protein s6 [Chrysochromulina tobinii]|uniref:30s ribosomal protein s6 n=1 Tax=Chrysochromulina tobinii TaxID=1460289 RepID=A0A0M0J341_9EUKA|nr:30s ribosomal protein s6 [Chrysochromulina tobinii]|eukprot:KOO20956.1 30s ribosomal protein s6 [Chrysochromulina sp. CCMP291]